MKTKKEKIENLKKLVGRKAFRALLNRGVLKIWRNTSPHNWWIESERGNMLWHSGESALPNLEMFDTEHDSSRKVIPYWGADSYMPELSIFKLKKIYIKEEGKQNAKPK